MMLVSASVETTSTPRFSREIYLAGSYSIKNYLYGGSSTSRNFTDQVLLLQARYVPSSTVRYLLRQEIRSTSGASQYVLGPLQGASIGGNQSVNPRDNAALSGSSLQSITNLTADWNPSPRLNFTFELDEDIFAQEGREKNYKSSFRNTITYNAPQLTLMSKTVVSAESEGSAKDLYQYSTTGKASYILSRNMDTYLSYGYSKAVDKTIQSRYNSLEQGFNYYHFKTNGITRKVFEINEAFTYVQQAVDKNSIQTNRLTLGARYYPIKQLTLSAGASYFFAKNFGNYTVTYNGGIGMAFNLFQASIDYAYGKSKTDGRTEKKLMANVRKSF